MTRVRVARRFYASYFNVGDIILWGKYKNHRGKVVTFGQDKWGNPTIEIEPIPKGRKQNKVMGLFKIWRADVKENAMKKLEEEKSTKEASEDVDKPFFTAWAKTLDKEAQGLDLKDADDRVTFRLRLQQKLQHMPALRLKDLIENIGASKPKSSSNTDAIKAVANAYIDGKRIKVAMTIKNVVARFIASRESFPIGAKVLIDGRYKAVVKGVFLEGSSSFHFPHYKVGYVGGDKNVAVKADRVGVKTKTARGIPLGRTFNLDSVRIHRFRDLYKVWDLTNAGKRGKKVRVMSIAPSGSYRGDPQDWMESMSKALLDYPAYDSIKSFIKDVMADFPGEIHLREYEERGIDVEPVGDKITVQTNTGLIIEAKPSEFKVLNRQPLTHPQTGKPIGFQDTNYYSKDKKGPGAFFVWLQANLSKVNSMGMTELRQVWDNLDVKYDYH